jgi:flagellar motor switch protein FliN
MSAAALASPSRAGQEYCQVWFESLRQVLEQIRSEPFTLQSLSPEEGDPYSQPEGGMWLRFSAEKRLRGEQAVFVSQADALALAGVLMGEPPDPSAEFDEFHADAAAELLRQAAGSAATALGIKLGGEVRLILQASDRPQWTPAAHVAMRCGSAQVSPVGVHLFLSQELAAAIKPAEAQSDVSPRDQSRTANSLRQDSPTAANLEFLREVELEVYLRLGERQLLVRDILDLGRGGVVELDQQVQDPVELLVGQKVVARGQLVIVDGNYGLRVTEIAAREERLDSVRR